MKMERKELEERWWKSNRTASNGRIVYIGNKGGYVIANDYLIYANTVTLFVNGADNVDIQFGEFVLDDISGIR